MPDVRNDPGGKVCPDASRLILSGPPDVLIRHDLLLPLRSLARGVISSSLAGSDGPEQQATTHLPLVRLGGKYQNSFCCWRCRILNMEESNDLWETIKPLTSNRSALFVESAFKLLLRSNDKFSLKTLAAIDYMLEIMPPH